MDIRINRHKVAVFPMKKAANLKLGFVEKELSEIPKAERPRVSYRRGQILQKSIRAQS